MLTKEQKSTSSVDEGQHCRHGRFRVQVQAWVREFSLCLFPALLIIVLSADSLQEADANGASVYADGSIGTGLSLDEIVRSLGRELKLTETEMVHLGRALENARLQLSRLNQASVVDVYGDPAGFLTQQQRIIEESLEGTAEFLSKKQYHKLRVEIAFLLNNWQR